jgi:hypothetical protein
MSCSIVSNTCVGASVTSALHPNSEYNTPFISSLIPNDSTYLRLIQHLDEYIKMTPILGNPKENWYIHPAIRIPYPVIFLGDIEIHCIHEESTTIAIDKFTRRLNRMREFMKDSSNRVYACLSYGELLSNHSDIQGFITSFCKPVPGVTTIFLGPPKYHPIEGHYIDVPVWDNANLSRGSSGVYNFNDQNYNSSMFIQYIKQC